MQLSYPGVETFSHNQSATAQLGAQGRDWAATLDVLRMFYRQVSTAYQMNFYNDLVPWMTAEATHDLQSRRYLLSGLSNEVKREASFGHEALRQDFKPDALRRLGGKN